MTKDAMGDLAMGEAGKKYERGLVDGDVWTLTRGGDPSALAAGVAAASLNAESTDDSDAERWRRRSMEMGWLCAFGLLDEEDMAGLGRAGPALSANPQS